MFCKLGLDEARRPAPAVWGLGDPPETWYDDVRRASLELYVCHLGAPGVSGRQSQRVGDDRPSPAGPAGAVKMSVSRLSCASGNTYQYQTQSDNKDGPSFHFQRPPRPAVFPLPVSFLFEFYHRNQARGNI